MAKKIVLKEEIDRQYKKISRLSLSYRFMSGGISLCLASVSDAFRRSGGQTAIISTCRMQARSLHGVSSTLSEGAELLRIAKETMQNLDAAIRQHEAAGTDATAICAGQGLESSHSNYILGEDGLVKYIDLFRTGNWVGIPSLEGYVFNKDKLLELMDVCQARGLYRFHQDAMTFFLYEAGGKMDVYIHKGYARIIRSVDEYYEASRDVLTPDIRRELFPADRPVRTKIHEHVSTYYGEHAASRNSLVGDNCIIFSGCKVGPGAKLRGCILMRNCVVEAKARLNFVIADKNTRFSANSVLVGSPKLPTVVPKDAQI